MKIGIIGGGGFLGKALIDAGANAELSISRILIPHDYRLMEKETVFRVVEESGSDIIINSAAVRPPKSKLELYLNSEFPSQLENVILSRGNNQRLIHISSLNVIVKGLHDPYSESKRMAERNLCAPTTLIIRPSLIWSWIGGGDAGRMQRYLGRSKLVPVPYPGNLHKPVNIDKLADKILALATENRNKVVCNIIGDKLLSTWELASKMRNKQGYPWLFPVLSVFGSLPGPKALRSVDYTKWFEENRITGEETIVLPFQDSPCNNK